MKYTEIHSLQTMYVHISIDMIDFWPQPDNFQVHKDLEEYVLTNNHQNYGPSEQPNKSSQDPSYDILPKVDDVFYNTVMMNTKTNPQQFPRRMCYRLECPHAHDVTVFLKRKTQTQFLKDQT